MDMMDVLEGSELEEDFLNQAEHRVFVQKGVGLEPRFFARFKKKFSKNRLLFYLLILDVVVPLVVEINPDKLNFWEIAKKIKASA